MTFRVEIRDPHERETEWWFPSSPSSDDDFTALSDPGMNSRTGVGWNVFSIPSDVGFLSIPTSTHPGGSKPSTTPITDGNAAQETTGTGASETTGPTWPFGASPHPTASSASSTSPPSLSSTAPQNEDSTPRSKTLTHVVATVIPLVFLAILGVVLFFYLRRRRRQKKQAFVQQEMKRNSPTAYAPTGPQQAYYQSPPGPPPPALSPMPPQPVILGPIAPNSNGAYYTGIDTSDVVSMHEPTMHQPTGLGNPFVDPQHEEPPPPYRPRSLAPLSRNTSVQSPPLAALSQTNLIAAQEHSRSPFRNPHDDDNISEFSEPTGPQNGRRAVDELSAVSDLSYQQDPVVERPAV
jgi:hypothetical protein